MCRPVRFFCLPLALVAISALAFAEEQAQMSSRARVFFESARKQRDEHATFLINAWESSLKHTKAELSEYRRLLPKIKAARLTGKNTVNERNGARTYATRQAREADVMECKEAITSTENKITKMELTLELLKLDTSVFVPDIDTWQLEAGQAGCSITARPRIIQVIDKSNMICIERDDDPYWVKGVPTAGLKAGDTITVEAYIFVVGTREYRSTLGQVRTVPQLEVLNVSELTPFLNGARLISTFGEPLN